MHLELEPEVEEWLGGLAAGEFGTVAFHLDRLVERGAQLRMPHSRALGEGLFELRFDLGRVAQRITYFFAGGDRIVLLTVFRKQRMNEAQEIKRARRAMKRCVDEQHTAEDD
ncbi:MAG: type II toxin-antitoxin system RelE/ParE family toxin [Actinobacteria bacterium]|nr:type II toxin-antitoxin system RelE/ParE family toxin [Actinomycetota bacterium]